MNLISPSQIKGGKRTFQDVTKHTGEISILTNKVDYIMSETSVLEKLSVVNQGQTQFSINSLTVDRVLSSKEPLRLNVNGILYYEPCFSLDTNGRVLTWNNIESKGGFRLDVDDTIILEISVNNK